MLTHFPNFARPAYLALPPPSGFRTLAKVVAEKFQADIQMLQQEGAAGLTGGRGGNGGQRLEAGSDHGTTGQRDDWTTEPRDCGPQDLGSGKRKNPPRLYSAAGVG